MAATDFFGPDLARGPFTSTRLETAAVQIAAALAQLRAPVLRSDDEIRTHVDFIRELADRLGPEYAAQLFIDVGSEISNTVSSTFRLQPGAYNLLHCWLADSVGGGETTVAPTTVTWLEGTVIKELTTRTNYIVLTSSTGLAQVRVDYASARTWRWAVSRYARVYYSSAVTFA